MKLDKLRPLITREDRQLIADLLKNGQTFEEKVSAVAHTLGKYTRAAIKDEYIILSKRPGIRGAQKIDKWCEVFDSDYLSIGVLEEILNTPYFDGQKIPGYIVKGSDMYNCLYDRFNILKNIFILDEMKKKLSPDYNEEDYKKFIRSYLFFIKKENIPKYCAHGIQYLCLEENVNFFDNGIAQKFFKVIKGDTYETRYNIDVVFYFGVNKL